MPPTGQRAAERANELATSQNAADKPESRRVSQRADKPADHHKVAHRLQPRAFLVALGPETDGLVRQRQVATVAHRCGREVQKPGGDVDCLYHRLACVQHTMYDRDGQRRKWTTLQTDDVANRQHRKWTTSQGTTLQQITLQTDDESYAARLLRSPPQGHPHRGSRQQRTMVEKGTDNLP